MFEGKRKSKGLDLLCRQADAEKEERYRKKGRRHGKRKHGKGRIE